MRPAPPPLACWLLETALPRDDRGATIRGDVLEEFQARAATAPASAARWYWRQAIDISVRATLGRRFGAQVSDRHSTRASFMDALTSDLTGSVRSLAKSRGFAAACIATLALGIGAATAVFSVVEAVLMRPLPITDPARVMWMSETFLKTGGTMSVAWPDYLDWRQQLHAFEDEAALVTTTMNLTGNGTPERLFGRQVTSHYFRVLGVRPALGRDFTEEDDRVGAAPVAIISNGFWRDHFESSPDVLGRTVTLNAETRTIIGVLPASFRYNPLQNDSVFVPLGATATDESGLPDRGNHNGLTVVARLRPGMTVDAARQELNDVESALRARYAATNANVGGILTPLAERLTNGVGAIIRTLFAAVAVLLLLAAINVASLAVARGVSRQQELAVRAALGCSRWRLIRFLLVEHLLLAIAGGVGGLVVAAGLIRLLVAAAPPDIPRLDEARIDVAVWAFALGAAIGIALLVALLPGLQATRARGQQALVRSSRGETGSASGQRARRALMVVEIALAVVLLTGAGLMGRTLRALTTVDPGFDPTHLLTMRFTINGSRATEAAGDAFDERLRSFYDRLLAGVAATPGVVSSSASLSLPIDGSQWNSVFTIAGDPTPALADLPSAAWEPITPGYFDTLRMHVTSGRAFTAADVATSSPVIVVNDAFVRQVLHGGPALGRRVRQGWPTSTGRFREIVGVVADVKLSGLDQNVSPEIYAPMTQIPSSDGALIVRTVNDPASVLPAVRRIVASLDPTLPLFDVQTMDDKVDASVAPQRLTMLIFSGFAGLALILACVGLYGVVAHGVSARTREIGVRLALGATGRQVTSLFVGQGLATTLVGLVIGGAIGIALAKVVEAQGLLFHVSGRDPASFAVAAAMLLAVAAIACYVPARRASRVDPTVALRGE